MKKILLAMVCGGLALFTLQTFGQDPGTAPVPAAPVSLASLKATLLAVAALILSMVIGRFVQAFRAGAGLKEAVSAVWLGTNGPAAKLLVLAAALAVFGAGCITRSTTTINTPAVYNVSTNAAGLLASNLVSAASVVTKVEKERMFLPTGYAVFTESDIYGFDAEMTSLSSTLPNVKLGIAHNSIRWIPTSTNQLYAASMSESGNVNNKAVPFYMAMSGQFTAGPTFVSQGTDTNGNSTITTTTVIPAPGLAH